MNELYYKIDDEHMIIGDKKFKLYTVLNKSNIIFDQYISKDDIDNYRAREDKSVKEKELVKSLADELYYDTPEKIEFCHLNFNNYLEDAGIYAWVLDGKVKYIGKTTCLKERFNSTGYGSISCRNIFYGGQSTNCKMNRHIVNEVKYHNKTFAIYFYHSNYQNEKEIKRVIRKDEKELLNKFKNTIKNDGTRAFDELYNKQL